MQSSRDLCLAASCCVICDTTFGLHEAWTCARCQKTWCGMCALRCKNCPFCRANIDITEVAKLFDAAELKCLSLNTMQEELNNHYKKFLEVLHSIQESAHAGLCVYFFSTLLPDEFVGYSPCQKAIKVVKSAIKLKLRSLFYRIGVNRKLLLKTRRHLTKKTMPAKRRMTPEFSALRWRCKAALVVTCACIDDKAVWKM